MSNFALALRRVILRARHIGKRFCFIHQSKIAKYFKGWIGSQKTLMLVAYPLPDKGYRYPIRRGSGLFITFKAFGGASIEIFSRIVPRFSFFKKPTIIQG